jgi:hypothetical protein
MQLWALLPAMEDRRAFREVYGLPGVPISRIRDMARAAFDDECLADHLAAKAAERELRAGRTPED